MQLFVHIALQVYQELGLPPWACIDVTATCPAQLQGLSHHTHMRAHTHTHTPALESTKSASKYAFKYLQRPKTILTQTP